MTTLDSPLITHVMRAPTLGGSELETLAIVQELKSFTHRVIYPKRLQHLGAPLLDAFREHAQIEAVEHVEHAWNDPAGIVHIQFPFVLTDTDANLDSVLELRELPRCPTVFTVHAAVNVPVVDDVHYVFHTDDLARRFRDSIAPTRVTLCPSLVAPPATIGRGSGADETCRVLWVSRNEDGKFHPELDAIVTGALDAAPNLRFTFVGRPDPEYLVLPERAEVEVIDAPAPYLAEHYASADVFWHFPHSLLEETWCRTLTEAMGHGLPAVVASHGAMRFQVEHGRSGLVVDSVESCIDALVALGGDSKRRASYGTAARARAESFFEDARAALTTLYSAKSQAAVR